MMQAEINFDSCSHIYTSDDGALGVERVPEGWIVYRRNGRDTQSVEFYSRSREACEAFVLGYDVGRRNGR